MDTRTLMTRTRDFGSAVRGTFRRDAAPRPACPRCRSRRDVGLVSLTIDEVAGHYDTEERDWRCQRCRVTIRERASVPADLG